MHIRKACDICGCTRLKPVYRLYSFDVLRCLDCNTLCRNIIFDKNESKDLYSMDYFCDLQEDYFFKHIGLREKAFGRKVLFINGVRPEKGRLLDLGCATGLFIKKASEAGWDAQGVEFSEFAARYAVEKQKVKVQCGDLMDMHFPGEYFDAVTMWDMVDHSESPKDVVKEVNRILKPGGIVAMDTFMEDALIFLLANALYKATFGVVRYPCFKGHPIHHSHYFSTKTFGNLLKSAGFDIILNEPECLDAEVVSLRPIEKKATAVMNWLSKYVGKQMEMVVIGRKPRAGEGASEKK